MRIKAFEIIELKIEHKNAARSEIITSAICGSLFQIKVNYFF